MPCAPSGLLLGSTACVRSRRSHSYESGIRVNIAVIGAQWGDEGKGKIVDLLTRHVSVVARYQGGHNAGHTVNVGDAQFILHLLPSGILHPDVRCVIGNGVVVDPDALFAEIDTRNVGSVRLVESLGLTRIATTQDADFFKGASSDEYKYSVSREDWREVQSTNG